MLPGFVWLGALAVLFQLLVVAGFTGYLEYRNAAADPAGRLRALGAVGGGTVLFATGELAALGAVGSLRVTPLLSFEQAMAVTDAGLLVAVVGYVLVFAGFVFHGRTSESGGA